ncbi:MAG: hypothetical protein IPM42_12155 [Saprospiraceae bacterium]|nr:hypothetical protein [Saprospiraceae bacterium]
MNIYQTNILHPGFLSFVESSVSLLFMNLFSFITFTEVSDAKIFSEKHHDKILSISGHLRVGLFVLGKTVHKTNIPIFSNNQTQHIFSLKFL